MSLDDDEVFRITDRRFNEVILPFLTLGRLVRGHRSLRIFHPILQHMQHRRERPDNSALIGQLPMEKVTPQNMERFTGNTCAICIDEFELSVMTRRLPCGHDYHQECIDKWLSEHLECPLCKKHIGSTVDEVHNNIIAGRDEAERKRREEALSPEEREALYKQREEESKMKRKRMAEHKERREAQMRRKRMRRGQHDLTAFDDDNYLNNLHDGFSAFAPPRSFERSPEPRPVRVVNINGHAVLIDLETQESSNSLRTPQPHTPPPLETEPIDLSTIDEPPSVSMYPRIPLIYRENVVVPPVDLTDSADEGELTETEEVDIFTSDDDDVVLHV